MYPPDVCQQRICIRITWAMNEKYLEVKYCHENLRQFFSKDRKSLFQSFFFLVSQFRFFFPRHFSKSIEYCHKVRIMMSAYVNTFKATYTFVSPKTDRGDFLNKGFVCEKFRIPRETKWNEVENNLLKTLLFSQWKYPISSPFAKLF